MLNYVLIGKHTQTHTHTHTHTEREERERERERENILSISFEETNKKYPSFKKY